LAAYSGGVKVVEKVAQMAVWTAATTAWYLGDVRVVWMVLWRVDQWVSYVAALLAARWECEMVFVTAAWMVPSKVDQLDSCVAALLAAR
jgi:hypothetical protein